MAERHCTHSENDADPHTTLSLKEFIFQENLPYQEAMFI